MKLRRKLQERLRQQSCDQAGSERARPSNDDASSRRAAQRALKAPSVALAAVESAAIPITLEREGPLHKMLEQAQAQVDKLNDLPCDANDKEYADWQFNHALLLFMWKKCQSLELSLGEHGPPMDAMLPFPKGDETKEVRDKSVALYAEILPLWMACPCRLSCVVAPALLARLLAQPLTCIPQSTSVAFGDVLKHSVPYAHASAR